MPTHSKQRPLSEKMQVPYLTWAAQARLAREHNKLMRQGHRLTQRLQSLNPRPDSNSLNTKRQQLLKALKPQLTQKTQTLNQSQAKLPPKLMDARKPAFSGLENPYASYIMLRHYELWHRSLTPSLSALKTKLEETLELQGDKLKEAEEDLKHIPNDTKEHWLKHHHALTEFATAWYAQDLVENQFQTAEDNKPLTANDHGWFLAPEEDDKKDLENDAKLTDELKPHFTDQLDQLKTEYEHDKETTNLINAVDARLNQLKILRNILEKSCNDELMKEYEMQRGLLEKEISALHKRVETVNKYEQKPALLEPLKQAQQKLEDAQASKAFEVSTDKSFYHWEKKPNGFYKKVPVTANGSELKYDPIHFEAYLKKQLAEKPHTIKNIKKIDAEGTRRISFSSENEKRNFFNGYASYLKEQEQKSNDYQNKTNNPPAVAQQVNPPASAQPVSGSVDPEPSNTAPSVTMSFSS